MPEAEGVIKYRLDYRAGPLPTGIELAELQAWHQICHRLGLLGQDPTRYDGYAYGNISRRIRQGFVISGTQTAGQPHLGADDYALVDHWSTDDNLIRATGPCRPSSEALTHAAIYDLSAGIDFVIHVHSPEIWRRADTLRLRQTRIETAYGTPEMARDVGRLFADHPDAGVGIFAMPGHEDGVVAFGPDAGTTGTAMTGLLAAALAL